MPFFFWECCVSVWVLRLVIRPYFFAATRTGRHQSIRDLPFLKIFSIAPTLEWTQMCEIFAF
jgi:hypothetical protein